MVRYVVVEAINGGIINSGVIFDGSIRRLVDLTVVESLRSIS